MKYNCHYLLLKFLNVLLPILILLRNFPVKHCEESLRIFVFLFDDFPQDNVPSETVDVAIVAIEILINILLYILLLMFHSMEDHTTLENGQM